MMKSLSKKEVIIITLVFILGIVVLLSFIFFTFFTKQPAISEYTEAEKKLPHASYQPIPDPQVRVGALVVTSNPDDARVIISNRGEEYSHSAGEEDGIVNITPFRIDQIAAGTHHLFVSKEGYEFQELDIEIIPDQINRISLSLLPTVDDAAEKKEKWVDQLPITESSYSIVYEPDQDTVRVRMTVPDLNAQQYQDAVQELEDEIRQRLLSLGINPSIQKVEWELN